MNMHLHSVLIAGLVQFEALRRDLHDPSQFQGKLHELSARIGMQVGMVLYGIVWYGVMSI